MATSIGHRAVVKHLASLSAADLAFVLKDVLLEHADLDNHPERDRSGYGSLSFLLDDDETEVTIGYRAD
jgi:hypothetical protein